MATRSQREQVFKGLGVSGGIGKGIVHLRESGALVVPEYTVPATKVADEQARLTRAVASALRQIGRLRHKARAINGAAGEELGYLLEAYHHMLKGSRLVRGAERRIAEERINAEAAVQAEVVGIAQQFADMQDAYMAARVADIREVGNRLLRSLTRAQDRPPAEMPKGAVVVAEELTPSDTALLDPTRVAGIATATGGAEGHTAIMARSLGLPAVLGAHGLLAQVRAGDRILLDGDAGTVVLNPTAETEAAYDRRRQSMLREKRRLARLRKQPAITRDGERVALLANMELPIELAQVSQSGAEGIGLLRSEFLFMNRPDVPGEDEQYDSLIPIIDAMDGRPVTVRTLDVGGEKTSPALMGPYRDSACSALGMRGIRLSLAQADVLETQFRAILRAATRGNVRILLPMVSTPGEVRRAREILRQAARRLRRRRVAVPDPLPPLGTMIEVPGAALGADGLARESDFFAIGSNDLTMYTLAIDRADENVADLYDPLHPAVLRLIQFSAAAALRARIPVSICGEMAGDARFAPLLLGMGIRDLSMVAASIPRVKSRIRDLDMSAAIQRVDQIMTQADAGRIAMMLDDFNGLAYR